METSPTPFRAFPHPTQKRLFSRFGVAQNRQHLAVESLPSFISGGLGDDFHSGNAVSALLSECVF